MSDRPSPVSTRVVAGFVFAIALLPRLWLAWTEAVEPVWDGHYYHFGAQRIASGHGYSDDAVVGGVLRWHPWCHYPVGYSGLLAVAYRVFGPGLQVGPLVNAVLGALVAVLTFLLVERVAGRARGLLASAFVAFSPELLLFTLLLMTEPSASLAPLVAALAAGAGVRRGQPLLGAALAGFFLGLGTLIRPQTLLGAPGLLLLALDPAALGASWRRAGAVAIVATAVAFAVVAPWTIRNCRVMDGCALVSTNAGWNLAIGAFPRATGRFETLRASDGCPVVTGQVQQDRCWASMGLAYIRAEPLRWLGLIPAKLSYTYDHASFAAGYLAEARPSRFGGERQEWLRKVMTGGHVLLMAAASLVTVTAPWRLQGRKRWAQGALLVMLSLLFLFLFTRNHSAPFWWLAVLTPLLPLIPLPGRPVFGGEVRYLLFTYAALSVTHATFFGEDRYHVFLTPTLAALAALGLRAGSVSGTKPAGLTGLSHLLLEGCMKSGDLYRRCSPTNCDPVLAIALLKHPTGLVHLCHQPLRPVRYEHGRLLVGALEEIDNLLAQEHDILRVLRGDLPCVRKASGQIPSSLFVEAIALIENQGSRHLTGADLCQDIPSHLKLCRPARIRGVDHVKQMGCL